METIKVKKDELLAIIKENRKKHKKEYIEAIRAYRVKAGDLMAKELEKIISGEKFETNIQVIKPHSNLKDYDLIIQMLKMSIDDTVELESHEFSRYVNDEWNWKASFSNSSLSNSSHYGTSKFKGLSGTSGTAGSAGVSSAVGNGTTGVSNVPEPEFDVTFGKDEVYDESDE